MRQLHEGPDGPVDMQQAWSLRHGLLTQVACSGHAELLDYMLSCGCDITTTTRYGASLLQCGAAHRAVVGVLLERGYPDINYADKRANTALHLARCVPVTRLLVQRGADWNATNVDGETAEVMAALEGRDEIALWLAELRTRGSYGRWLAEQRWPLVYLHRLLADGRATQLPQPHASGNTTIETWLALAFVFPRMDSSGLPIELFPNVLRHLVEPP
jgi:hypothetical protein